MHLLINNQTPIIKIKSKSNLDNNISTDNLRMRWPKTKLLKNAMLRSQRTEEVTNRVHACYHVCE